MYPRHNPMSFLNDSDHTIEINDEKGHTYDVWLFHSSFNGVPSWLIGENYVFYYDYIDRFDPPYAIIDGKPVYYGDYILRNQTDGSLYVYTPSEYSQFFENRKN